MLFGATVGGVEDPPLLIQAAIGETHIGNDVCNELRSRDRYAALRSAKLCCHSNFFQCFDNNELHNGPFPMKPVSKL